ncbi:MAG: hypothetical protein R3F37_22445 [Candidatus Competibacteraceae bacterium]
MAAVTRQAVLDGQAPPPRLLYREEELNEMRKLQAIAMNEPLGKSRNERACFTTPQRPAIHSIYWLRERPCAGCGGLQAVREAHTAWVAARYSSTPPGA